MRRINQWDDLLQQMHGYMAGADVYVSLYIFSNAKWHISGVRKNYQARR